MYNVPFLISLSIFTVSESFIPVFFLVEHLALQLLDLLLQLLIHLFQIIGTFFAPFYILIVGILEFSFP